MKPKYPKMVVTPFGNIYIIYLWLTCYSVYEGTARKDQKALIRIARRDAARLGITNIEIGE